MRSCSAAGFLSHWIFITLATQAATVTITPTTITVAQGTSVTFTVYVTPSSQIQQITLAYQGETETDTGTASPFSTAHSFTTPADNVMVTATVLYNNGAPADQVSAVVNVVGLTLQGAVSLQRTWQGIYTIQSNPSGKSLGQITWSYAWQGGVNTIQNVTAWSGKMVADGTMTISATVSGVACTIARNISILPRNWPTPVSCDQDNDPDFGDLPTPQAQLSDNRDFETNYAPYIFSPRSGPRDFSTARTLTRIVSGPCTGVWYVSSSSLQCHRETVISRYIKSGGPDIAGMSFPTANAACFTTSPAQFVQALKNHEYRGPRAEEKSIAGHQGRIEGAVSAMDGDARQLIEGLVDSSQSALNSAVNAAINSAELFVRDVNADESYDFYYGPNWGGEGSLGSGSNARTDEQGSGWTPCGYGPDVF